MKFLAEGPERMEQLFLSWGPGRGACFREQSMCSAEGKWNILGNGAQWGAVLGRGLEG